MTILLALVLAEAVVAKPPADRPLAPLAMLPPPRAAVIPTAPARPSREQVLAAVRVEWPRYDSDRNGGLAPLEFSTWVMQANGVKVGQGGIKPVSAMNATARAFAAADANHDGAVTPEEMAVFLMR